MAGGLMVEPAGRVTLSPSEMNARAAERRGDKPKRHSKREHAARLAAQRRLDSVLAPQRPMLDRVVFTDYLRNGSI